MSAAVCSGAVVDARLGLRCCLFWCLFLKFTFSDQHYRTAANYWSSFIFGHLQILSEEIEPHAETAQINRAGPI